MKYFDSSIIIFYITNCCTHAFVIQISQLNDDDDDGVSGDATVCRQCLNILCTQKRKKANFPHS